MKDLSEREDSLFDEDTFEVSFDDTDPDMESMSFLDSDEDFDDFDSEDDLDDFNTKDLANHHLRETETIGLSRFSEELTDYGKSGDEKDAGDGSGEKQGDEIPEISLDETDEEAAHKKIAVGSFFERFRNNPSLKKAAIMAGAGALCVLIVFGIVAAVLKSNSRQSAEASSAEEGPQIVVVEQQVSDVRFLSFGPLSIEDEEGYLSVKDFSQILDKLYADDFVLIDIYALGQADESGNMILNKTIDVPEGKKPLIIMQRDVSYPLSRQNGNFAKRLVVDSEGYLRTEYTDAEEESYMGDYDLIPMLETFIREHPDFSYNNARGILGLTGYNGILGYRTSSYLASEENNPYGVFDTENQIQAMQSVLETLQSSGWRFASNGFGYRISYGSEYSLVENDAFAWRDQVVGLIGGSDILMLPRQTDIGSWAPYDENNTKYTLMKGLGFRIYLIAEDETPGLMLARNEYLRIAVTEINSNSEFEAAFREETAEEPSGEPENETSAESENEPAEETEEEPAA